MDNNVTDICSVVGAALTIVFCSVLFYNVYKYIFIEKPLVSRQKSLYKMLYIYCRETYIDRLPNHVSFLNICRNESIDWHNFIMNEIEMKLGSPHCNSGAIVRHFKECSDVRTLRDIYLVYIADFCLISDTPYGYKYSYIGALYEEGLYQITPMHVAMYKDVMANMLWVKFYEEIHIKWLSRLGIDSELAAVDFI